MLENNPMGSRRRLRFYHRIGVVPIPGHQLNDFSYVPKGFIAIADPEMYNDPQEDVVRGTVVSVSALLCRLLDIVNNVIDLAEAKDRDSHDDKTTDSQDDTEKETAKAETEAESENETHADSKNKVENESETEPQAE